ncbi:hypothetical protein P8C59_003819 [Phyllachora maydis]|uniref:Uncharacterized protein n=1 Tax=Phyllachora maydis TaxID=1825666 RepID=A0AAD9I2H9_9PEZI|nr:hypothetical protein P8C59_003819 [Phyllachora maydis]
MTLDRVEGTLVVHEERFTLTFCEPFQRPVRLELASRFRRQIIILLGRADRFLKPRWPVTWQTYETFRAVQGYTEAVDLVAQEDFGALKRTLDAYLAAYSCDAVEWEVNWKTRFPEFRLLRSEKGEGYSCLQLLAVMRALRFNDYFQSLSFRDVDLGVLRNRFDQGPMTSPVGWFNQGGMVLDEDERAELSQSSVLHQELHALAFCSSAIRQLDLAYALRHTCLSSDQQGQWTGGRSSCLAPIWNLLKGGCTRCNNLILAGNSLSATDVLELGNALRMGLIQGLDVAHCGLDDASLTYLARAMMLRELNLCGTIQGCIEGPLVPFDALWQLPKLRELDLTHAKVNEATLSDLERFLVHRRRAMKDGKPSEFQHLVLVNCGITGARACRLFNAIGEKRGMHLFLNSNPLEQGVEQLADAIRCSRGPAGLSMEMVEFRHEANFARLMNALAETKHMSFLSLVGTAPVPRLDRACSPSTVSALENFFSHNQSVRFLDFSGIRGRLEEGQMGRGFGRSVRSLRQNTTLTWLRLRNQNLHDDVGALGIVIEDNDTLETLDCQENNLNMTSLQFLVDSLGKNRRITGFPLSRAERERIWQSIVASLAQAASSSNKKAQSLRQQQQRDLLRSVFDRTLAELDEHLARNRAAAQAASARLLPSGDEADSRDDTTPVEETWTPTGALGGSCAFPGPESGRERADDGDEGGDGDDGSTPKAGPPRRPTIRGSTIAVDLLDSAPLQAQDEEGDGMERAVDLPDATRSEFSTPPPGLASPVTPEHVVYPGVIQA